MCVWWEKTVLQQCIKVTKVLRLLWTWCELCFLEPLSVTWIDFDHQNPHFSIGFGWHVRGYMNISLNSTVCNSIKIHLSGFPHFSWIQKKCGDAEEQERDQCFENSGFSNSFISFFIIPRFYLKCSQWWCFGSVFFLNLERFCFTLWSRFGAKMWTTTTKKINLGGQGAEDEEKNDSYKSLNCSFKLVF